MNENTDKLFKELAKIIDRGNQMVTSQVNSTMTLVYWNVGKRINEEVLKNKRAEYGKQILTTVSSKLVERFGRSFTKRNIRRMIEFSIEFEDKKIVTKMSQQLSWSHFIELFTIEN